MPDASVAGQGSKSRQVTVLVDVNSALLALKRGGIVDFSKALGTYLYWVPRGLLAALILRRSRERRSSSVRHAFDHLLAVWKLLKSPARLYDFYRRGRAYPAGASRSAATSPT